MAEVVDPLRKLPLFAGLHDDDLARIAGMATEFEAPANQVLIERGQVGAGMFVIEEGEMVVDLGNREIRRGPGDYVGEMALFTEGGRRNARVRTATPVRCLAIARSDFDELIEDHPQIASAMLRVLAERLAETDA